MECSNRWLGALSYRGRPSFPPHAGMVVSCTVIGSDEWFIISWGILPVPAGDVLQTDEVSPPCFHGRAGNGCLSFMEMTAEKAYKKLKQV